MQEPQETQVQSLGQEDLLVGCGNPLQYPCLENPMNRGAWWAIVHGVTKSQTWLKQLSIYTIVIQQCHRHLLTSTCLPNIVNRYKDKKVNYLWASPGSCILGDMETAAPTKDCRAEGGGGGKGTWPGCWRRRRVVMGPACSRLARGMSHRAPTVLLSCPPLQSLHSWLLRFHLKCYLCRKMLLSIWFAVAPPLSALLHWHVLFCSQHLSLNISFTCSLGHRMFPWPSKYPVSIHVLNDWQSL